MKKYVYPAVFTQEREGVSVNFPDVACCFTSGKNMPEALEMAADVLAQSLCRLEDAGALVPPPSDMAALPREDGDIVSLVGCDTRLFREMYDNSPVTVTVVLPNWLKNFVERMGMNASEILRDALTARLTL